MIYLSGSVRDGREYPPEIGVLVQPRSGYRELVPSFPWWGADTGLFTGDAATFSVAGFLEHLEPCRAYRSRCLFVNAPDVVGDCDSTLRYSLPALPLIRAAGWPAGFVAQDGLTVEAAPWDEFDALFIGGSTEWKLSRHVWRLVREARRLEKWAHMGRVNSSSRMMCAGLMGCQSVDGTFLKFGPDKNLPRLLRWFEQPLLPLGMVA